MNFRKRRRRWARRCDRGRRCAVRVIATPRATSSYVPSAPSRLSSWRLTAPTAAASAADAPCTKPRRLSSTPRSGRRTRLGRRTATARRWARWLAWSVNSRAGATSSSAATSGPPRSSCPTGTSCRMSTSLSATHSPVPSTPWWPCSSPRRSRSTCAWSTRRVRWRRSRLTPSACAPPSPSPRIHTRVSSRRPSRFEPTSRPSTKIYSTPRKSPGGRRARSTDSSPRPPPPVATTKLRGNSRFYRTRSVAPPWPPAPRRRRPVPPSPRRK